MATSIAEMVPALREALSVDNSFDATIIGMAERCMKRLLRDYHFPKSLRLQAYTNLILGAKEYTLPAGFKKEHLIRFYDPVEGTYTHGLTKREGPVGLPLDGIPRHYWLQGAKFITDIAIEAESVGITMQLFYESMDVAGNESWFVGDFEDVLFTFTMYRGASELQKPDLAKSYAALWAEDRTSLAVYANELEFDGSEFYMNAAAPVSPTRYPKV